MREFIKYMLIGAAVGMLCEYYQMRAYDRGYNDGARETLKQVHAEDAQEERDAAENWRQQQAEETPLL